LKATTETTACRLLFPADHWFPAGVCIIIKWLAHHILAGLPQYFIQTELMYLLIGQGTKKWSSPSSWVVTECGQSPKPGTNVRGCKGCSWAASKAAHGMSKNTLGTKDARDWVQQNWVTHMLAAWGHQPLEKFLEIRDSSMYYLTDEYH
jgi:hypothetical protein